VPKRKRSKPLRAVCGCRIAPYWYEHESVVSARAKRAARPRHEVPCSLTSLEVASAITSAGNRNAVQCAVYWNEIWRNAGWSERRVKTSPGRRNSQPTARRRGRKASGARICSAYASFLCVRSVPSVKTGLPTIVASTVSNERPPAGRSDANAKRKLGSGLNAGMITNLTAAKYSALRPATARPARGRLPEITK
jgi:hypothetical protein